VNIRVVERFCLALLIIVAGHGSQSDVTSKQVLIAVAGAIYVGLAAGKKAQ
jgi:hypothetical protein